MFTSAIACKMDFLDTFGMTSNLKTFTNIKIVYNHLLTIIQPFCASFNVDLRQAINKRIKKKL